MDVTPHPAHPGDPGERCRARDIGLVPPGSRGDPGPYNAITDVPGVAVGHTTLVESPDVHTGVTAVVPEGVGPAPGGRLAAGLFAGNGYGKLVGATQTVELGLLESPVVLTATLSAFRAADAVVSWMLDRPDCAGVESFNPVVGECNDGYLSDIRARPVREEHVRAAIEGASRGRVAEGCVGAGTGTRALGFKAGIGTASRRVGLAARPPARLGVLTQANFGGTLRVSGHPVEATGDGPEDGADDGSCVIVLATDAPLDARQLTRVARRAVFALGRVGASYGHGSGDYALAFSTATATETGGGSPVPDHHLDPLFRETLDAVEESVLNALCTATTTTGHLGRTARAAPLHQLRDLARRRAC